MSGLLDLSGGTLTSSSSSNLQLQTDSSFSSSAQFTVPSLDLNSKKLSLNSATTHLVVSNPLAAGTNESIDTKAGSLTLNGTAAHAFSHILYKALLFMSMGAVLYRTGTIKGSELGGLYKSMPYTTGLCIIGAVSYTHLTLPTTPYV